MFLWLSMNFFVFFYKEEARKQEIVMRLQVVESLLAVKIFECLNKRKNAN